MKISELRTRLSAIEKTLSSWGVKASDVADVSRLVQGLSSFDDLTVSEFCNRIENSAHAPNPLIGQALKAKGRQAVADDALVSHYVGSLSATNLDRPTFQTILADLEANKNAKMPELTTIAIQLSGVEAKFKNKSDALAKIDAIVRRRLDTDRRLAGTSGAF